MQEAVESYSNTAVSVVELSICEIFDINRQYVS